MIALRTLSEPHSTDLPAPVQPRTWVIGTAGHVDHGKSTLVKALTGIDPDRLKEEREREMTIDLGFAWLTLSDDMAVSVVDVPGHERFIKNMLAGVGGVDAALLVIAADEGPMPQTDEHLAILDLLEIEQGIVVLTKRDLVDEEWLELIGEETRERLEGTILSDAPMIAVSALSRDGLSDLTKAIHDMLRAMPERVEVGKPRLPIDRAFTVAGFGTVVTGTLIDGTLDVGQEVVVLPSGARARVRGLQSHGLKSERGVPGARTAVNLSGIDRESIERGHVLTVPGWLEATTILDVRLRLIAGAPLPLEQNDPVSVFIGAAEAAGHVTLLDAERLLPGDEGWVQIRLGTPVAVVAGDRFIVRQPSPSVTIGGGRVIDPHPRRHRRFRSEVITALETKATGTLDERLVHMLLAGPREVREIGEQLGISLTEIRDLLAASSDMDEIVVLGQAVSGPLAPNRLIAHRDSVERARKDVVALLADFHRRQPLRRGMPKEEVKSRIQKVGRVFDAMILAFVTDGTLVDHGSLLALAGHEIRLSAGEQEAADRFAAALRANPNSPPAPDGFGVTPDLLAALADMGSIVRLPDNVVFSAEQLAEIRRETLRMIDEQGSVTLAQFRDHFGSSRKYAQAVLEYFDHQRVTRRIGDTRVRGTSAG